MKEREILEKSIEEHQTAIGNAIAELAMLDKPKPKLRHGDYGLQSNANILPWIKIYNKIWYLEGNQKNASMLPDAAFAGEQVGNLVDDLKRNSEDLEEFEVHVHHGGTLKARIDTFDNDNDIEFQISSPCHHATANIYEAQEIHQKLGQLIATAKRVERIGIMKFAKGKLKAEYSEISDAYIIIDSKDRLIACHLSKANAEEFVRRWNAFEEGGLVKDSEKVGEELMRFCAGRSGVYEDGVFPTKAYELAKAFLAKAKE